ARRRERGLRNNRGRLPHLRFRRLARGQARHRRPHLARPRDEGDRAAMSGPPTAVLPARSHARVPVGIVLLVLLPLILMPLAAVFVFAFRGGAAAFAKALTSREAQFALRFSLVIAFATAAVNTVLGTYTAYVLSRYRFRGERPLAILVNLP